MNAIVSGGVVGIKYLSMVTHVCNSPSRRMPCSKRSAPPAGAFAREGHHAQRSDEQRSFCTPPLPHVATRPLL